MSSTFYNGVRELSSRISSFRDSFSRDTAVSGDPVSESLASNFGLIWSSREVSWKPRSLKENTFKKVAPHLQDLVPHQPSPSVGSSEIGDAYDGSRSTWSAIFHRGIQTMFHGDAFPNSFTSEHPYFCGLDMDWFHPWMHLECHIVFCSPPSPNITIISVQPQRGPPNKLVLTELWTLLYWAARLSKRGKDFTSFPVRVVSICGTKARFLSANFSRGFVRCLGKKAIAPNDPVTADIHIGSYYEMSQQDDFLRFLKQLVDIPISPPAYDPQSE